MQSLEICLCESEKRGNNVANKANFFQNCSIFTTRHARPYNILQYISKVMLNGNFRCNHGKLLIWVYQFIEKWVRKGHKISDYIYFTSDSIRRRVCCLVLFLYMCILSVSVPLATVWYEYFLRTGINKSCLRFYSSSINKSKLVKQVKYL